MVTAAVLAGRTGAETIIQFDGAANAVTTAAAPAYGLQHSFEARPGLMLQFGTPRQVWRASYLLVWNLDLDGETLTLIQPGATPAEDVTVDKVKYESAAPWSRDA